MDKRERVALFRERLATAMAARQWSGADLAAAVGVNRSTVSQLLAGADPRLPNGQIVAESAAALGVSADWLLGLASRAEPAAEILDSSMQIAGADRAPVDENLLAWQREAAGYKIRHVPATLPDVLKIEDVLRVEYRDYAAKTSDQAIADSQSRLAYLRLPEADMEICMSRQTLAAFARGEGQWEEVAAPQRHAQLAHMSRLLRELYPSLRLYLFDQRTHTSAPYTVFGPLRAAVYLGQTYFVFTTTKHIRALTGHFDALVRAAVVQADEAAETLDALRARHCPGATGR